MKHLKKLLVLLLVLVLISVGCQKDEQFPIDNLMENQDFERILKSGNYGDFLNNLIFKIETLVEEGYLNKGNGNAFMVKIKNAIKSLDKGKIKAANGKLNAFINQAKAFIKNGKLPDVYGQILIDDAQKAIDGDFSMINYWAFVDERDGLEYKTVNIGDQWWMAENLAYIPNVSPPDQQGGIWVYDYIGSEVSEAISTENYKDFGCLYDYTTALTACPSGWHLPSDSEWAEMEIYLGMSGGEAYVYGYRGVSGNVGISLKSTTGWYDIFTGDIVGNGTNSSGFNAIPGGTRYHYWPPGWPQTVESLFHDINSYANFWTSTAWIWFRGLAYHNSGVYRHLRHSDYGFSVRCVKTE